ncbi:MAG: peptide chain release factor N(5)-glutamine methyltransferase [Ruminococcaceae bacterium]|nr:peptide chain release factor N(5)-glutamine methyltransferase [Oscillospiraceae bacterium]
MLGKLKELWQSSDFARENLNFRETVGLLLEKYGYDRDTLLLGKEISCPELISDFEEAVKGEPFGYILGKVPFFKENFFVEEGVLIPRCDSEVLVEKAIELIPKNAVFADICTGSGCLGISVLKERPDLKAILLDISPIAKRVCEKNISSLGVADRCSFIQFDLFNDTLPQCSAILMNPPYITKEEMKKLPRNVMREPALALDGGEDGLDFYRYAASSKDFKNKLLIFEIGYMQGIALRELFGGGDIVPDLSGNDRVFILQ